MDRRKQLGLQPDRARRDLCNVNTNVIPSGQEEDDEEEEDEEIMYAFRTIHKRTMSRIPFQSNDGDVVEFCIADP